MQLVNTYHRHAFRAHRKILSDALACVRAQRWDEKAGPQDRRFIDSFNQIDALDGARRRPALKKSTNITERRKQTELAKRRGGQRGQIVGVDISDRDSHYCVLGREGEIAEEGTIRTTPAGFTAQFPGAIRCRIVIEVGTHSPWISRLLRGSLAIDTEELSNTLRTLRARASGVKGFAM